MSNNQVNASEQAMLKAKEIRARLSELHERVKNEGTSVQDIVLSDLKSKGLSEEQVAFVISGLKEGIQQYESQKKASEEGDVLTEETLTAQLEGMEEVQQKEKLINVLLMLSYLANTGENLKELRTSYDVKTIADLKAEVVEKANSISYKEILEMLHGCTEIVSDSDSEFFENFGELSADYKLYVAAQVYLEADKMDDKDAKSQLNAIGATSAAAVDIVRATISLESGEMSEPMWHTIVKGILLILTTVLISTLLAMTIVDSVMNVFILFTALFGFSGVTAFLGMVLGFAFGGGLMWVLYQAFDSMETDSIAEMDEILERWMSKIDEWFAMCKERVIAWYNEWRTTPEKVVETPSVETDETGKVVNPSGNQVVVQPNTVTV